MGASTHSAGHRARHPGAALVAVICLGIAACTSSHTSTTVSSEGTTVTTTRPPSAAFHSDGAEHDGWFWLENGQGSARWEFSDLPADVAALSLEVHAVVDAASVTTDGQGSMALTFGSGEQRLGTTRATLTAAPSANAPDLALLGGSVPLGASLTDGLSSLWVEAAAPASGRLAVQDGSVAMSVAAAAVRAAPQGASTPVPDTAVPRRVEGTFNVTGDAIAGWWWLRDSGYSHLATWVFSHLASLTDGAAVQFDLLATDRANGGPGIDARFWLTWKFLGGDGSVIMPLPGSGGEGALVEGDLGTSQPVTVPNVSPAGDPLGYRAQGQFEIEAGWVPEGATGLIVSIARVDPARAGEPTAVHVAVNDSSVGLLIAATGDGTGEGLDDTADGGGTNQWDGTLTDPDGLADADSQADADAVGDLPSGTYHGTLDGEDEDWFAFHLDTTQIVDISVTPATGLTVDIDLFNQGLDRRAPHPSQETDLAFSYAAGPGESGRYYLHLTRLAGGGAYDFTIDVRDADDAGMHVDAGDATHALTVGDGDFVGEVTRNDLEDHYLIQVGTGQALTVTVVPLVDHDLEVLLLDAAGHSLDDQYAYADEPAVMYLAAGAARTVDVAVQRSASDVGGPYRLRVNLGGVGECSATWVDPSGFVSSGTSDGQFISNAPGWYWLQPTRAAARYQQSTWTFTDLPDDSTVRVVLDMPIDASGPLSAGAYVVVGASWSDGRYYQSEPQYVSFRAVQRQEGLTGADAVGEITVAHSHLFGAAEWWVRLTLGDPSDPTGAAVAPVGLGNAITNLSLCASGSVAHLPGLSGPVEPTPVSLSFDAASHTITSNVGMFVDPHSDIDGDGLNQSWEDAASALANPVLELDEEELWLHWTYLLTANLVQVTPWPNAANPQYIVFGFLSTWAYDAGGGVIQPYDLMVFENHRGDSERIWQAWRVIDDETVQLEWVGTSAHASINDHSGVWKVGERQCNVGYIAKVGIDVLGTSLTKDWGYYQAMCAQLSFDGDGRLLLWSSQNKHAMYPSESVCQDAALAAWGETNEVIAEEDCGWWEPAFDPLGIWWSDDDFDDDPRYQGGGRWLFDIYNVGEPGHPLIDDFDDPSSWLGVTSAQVTALTGEYPNEGVWSGRDGSGHNFCGGLDEGDELPLTFNDIEVPGNCSTLLGSKLAEWQGILLDAMSSRYRVTVHTGTSAGAGTDEAITIVLRDADGVELARRLYYGDLENGATDIVYLTATSTGGVVAELSLKRTGDDTTFTDWQVATVTVDDLITGGSVTFTANQWVHQGEGITVSA